MDIATFRTRVETALSAAGMADALWKAPLPVDSWERNRGAPVECLFVRWCTGGSRQVWRDGEEVVESYASDEEQPHMLSLEEALLDLCPDIPVLRLRALERLAETRAHTTQGHGEPVLHYMFRYIRLDRMHAFMEDRGLLGV